MRYNPAIFPVRYVRFPKGEFEESISLSNSENFLIKLMRGEIDIPSNHIFHRRYFKVPEKIFIEYCNEDLDFFDAWILLSCYYLLDKKNNHVLSKTDVFETARINVGDFGIQLRYDWEFSFALMRLLLSDWIELNEDDFIIMTTM